MQPSPELTLDPEDWSRLKALGHRMVDDMFASLEAVREERTWVPIPESVIEAFEQPLPLKPQPAEAIYDEFLQTIYPYRQGNTHPRFWGWVHGSGTPLGALADFLAACMNSNAFGGLQSPVYIENTVIQWAKEMLGYDPSASGILLTGASEANLVSMTVARNSKAKCDVAAHGLQDSDSRMVYYGSTQMHSSMDKAVELLGLGGGALRKIPVNQRFEIDVKALEEAITADRSAGMQPVCVIGTAGTVATGAIDDLEALADLAERENLWFHVDGAFGAALALAPSLKCRVKGMERADSIAFDFHKWLHVPYDVGCALIRNANLHHNSFATAGNYLSQMPGGSASGPHWPNQHGIQLSRSFRALKVWMTLKEQGVERLGQLAKQNVEQAQYLASLVEADPNLELLAPAPQNIVCFRYVAPALSEIELNDFNKRLLIEVQERGIAVPTSTILHGRFAIRVSVTNHRSRLQDFDALVKGVTSIGESLSREKAAL